MPGWMERKMRNPPNYLKVNLLYTETGGKVLLQVIDWLYRGERPPETHLIILAKDKKTKKENKIQAHEEEVLKELSEKKLTLAEADFSILYLVIKLTCGFPSVHDPVWCKVCPHGKENCLERKLYEMYKGRCEIAHVQGKMFRISDDDVDRRSQILERIYFSVLEEAGTIGKADKHHIVVLKNLIKADIGEIAGGIITDMQKYNALLKQDVEFSSKHEYPEYEKCVCLDSPPPKKSKPNVSSSMAEEEEEEEEEEEDDQLAEGMEIGSHEFDDKMETASGFSTKSKKKIPTSFSPMEPDMSGPAFPPMGANMSGGSPAFPPMGANMFDRGAAFPPMGANMSGGSPAFPPMGANMSGGGPAYSIKGAYMSGGCSALSPMGANMFGEGGMEHVDELRGGIYGKAGRIDRDPGYPEKDGEYRCGIKIKSKLKIPKAKVTSRLVYNTIDDSSISYEELTKSSPYFTYWKKIYEK